MDFIKNFKENEQYIFGEGESVLTKSAEGYIVSNRKERFSSFAVHAVSALGECEALKTVIKLKTALGVGRFTAYHKIITQHIGLTFTTYEFGDTVEANHSEFSEISCVTNIPAGVNVVEFISYIVEEKKDEYEDIIIKEYDVSPIHGEKIVMSTTKERIPYQEKLKFGAIRWDAYFGTGNVDTRSVCDQVTTTLSPSHFHFMAPYFAEYVDENRIKFPVATQEQFDEEAKMALDAGIDFFAYCWYRNNDPMCYARRQHALSKYRDKLKMSVILFLNALDQDSLNTIIGYAKEDFFLKVENRPVIFLYDAFNTKDDKMAYFLNGLKEAGVESPYLIGMCSEASPYNVNKLIHLGCDAIGAYSHGHLGNGTKYNDYVASAEVINETKLSYFEQIDVVPTVCCGRDQRPRIENFVSWCGDVYKDNFVYPATKEELYEHTKRVLDSNKKRKSRINTVLAYAWNEHDEGGWICPTIAVDEKGKPIKDEKGNNIKNTDYLDAIKQALSEFRAEE